LAGGNIARPTTNVTGFVLVAPEIDDKFITLLMEAPSATHIGVLVNSNKPDHQSYPEAFKDARSVAGKVLIRIDTRGLADIDAALANARAERISALLFAVLPAHSAFDPQLKSTPLGKRQGRK
jgi:hypothetical protein